ncbi:hypothetical protein D3C71_1151300 [compost metagenome]
MSSRSLIFLGAFTGSVCAVLWLMLVVNAFGKDSGLAFGMVGKELDFTKDILLPLISTFFGAAAGSWYSYRFQLKTKEDESLDKEIALIRQVFLTLQSQFEELSLLKKMVVLVCEDNPIRFLTMPRIIGNFEVTERIDHSVSGPLIRLDKTEALMRVRSAEKSYLNIISIYSVYRGLKERYFDKLKEAGVGEMDMCSLKFKTKIVGTSTMVELYGVGESFVLGLDHALEDFVVALNMLTEILAENYSSKKYRPLILEVTNLDILKKVCPPKILSIDQLMENVGHLPKYVDESSGDIFPIITIAKHDWQPCNYVK